MVANQFLAVEPHDDRLRLLVVENNPSARERIRSALGDAYDVRFVSGSSEALDAMRADPPDLLVTEVDLPEGDGLRLCEEVRRLPEAEHLPIMVVTDRASIQDKVAGFQAGADDYVVKPVDTAPLPCARSPALPYQGTGTTRLIA